MSASARLDDLLGVQVAVLDGKEALAVLSGRQRHIPMAFNCRVRAKGDKFYIGVRHDDPWFNTSLTGTPCDDPQHKYKVVCEVSFISNRRWDEVRMLKEGKPDNGLPSTESELREMLADLGVSPNPDKKLTVVMWEVALVCQFHGEPFCISGVRPLWDSAKTKEWFVGLGW